LHRYGDLYYLSWGCFYAVASSPYGPFDYRGTVIDQALIAPDFRIGSQTSQPWYAREDYADRHGSFWTQNGQWFYACNDRSHSTDKSNPSYFRDAVFAYVHYYTNGSIAPVRIDAQGVGTYSAASIEAEDYFAIVSARKGHDSTGRFGVHGLRSGSTLSYPRIADVPRHPTLVLRLSNGSMQHGRVIARRGRAGQILCTASVPVTGTWESFVELPCVFNSPSPAHIDELLLEFVDVTTEFARLDSFRIV
jgi:arabinoxylan arabinofuranohydrolase